ncbi:MAG: MMPL family transporter [Coriobacteriia bacterium]
MSAFLYRVGKFCYRRRKLVLASTLILLALAAAGALLLGKGVQNNFRITGTESQQGIDALARTFPQVSGSMARVIVVAPDGQRVDDAATKDAIQSFIGKVEKFDNVASVASPFDSMIEGAINDDGTAAIVTIQYGSGVSLSDARSELEKAADDLRSTIGDGATVSAGGDIFTEIPTLTGIEIIGVILAFVILFLMFRSGIAAMIPLVTAVIGVGIASGLIYTATAVIDVPSVTPLLSIMIGLAVGIDYALFILSRHVDQLHAGMEIEDSAASAIATAGSAVVFAGVTVAIALLGLFVAGIPFLTIMGIGGAIGVVVAVLVALVLVPALLGFVGERVLPRSRSGSRRSAEVSVPRRGFYRGWVRATTSRPIVTIALITIVLVIIAIPAKDLHLTLPNNGVSSAGSGARITYDLIDEHFGPGYNGPLIVTANIVSSTDPVGVMNSIADELRALDGVEAIPLATPNETADTGIVEVIPTTAPSSEQTADLVRQIRGMESHFAEKYGVETKVTGFTAVGIDISERLGRALLPFGILVIGLSVLILMVVFRSIAVPLKATIGYALSILGAFGAVGAVFQWGWLSGALNVIGVGNIIAFLPIMLMGILFGLAMDYEVFLVSRMREEYVHGATAREAIEHGFVTSGPVVTAAALIMFGVFAAFVPSGDFNLKPIALGLAIGVFFDAFLVRMTLVPAVMSLLGDRAWRLPKRVDQALPVLDIEGEGLRNVLALAGWPADPEIVAAAEGLSLDANGDGGGTPIYRDVAFELPRKGLLAVRGERGSGKTALLLTIAGRMAPSDGRLKVLGRVLPDEAAAVRPSVGIVLCESADPACDQLDAALRLRPSVVVLDDVDLLAENERARLFGKLAIAMKAAEARSNALSLVMSGAAECPVPPFIDADRVCRVDLAAPPASPTAAIATATASTPAADSAPKPQAAVSNPGRDA